MKEIKKDKTQLHRSTYSSFFFIDPLAGNPADFDLFPHSILAMLFTLKNCIDPARVPLPFPLLSSSMMQMSQEIHSTINGTGRRSISTSYSLNESHIERSL